MALVPTTEGVLNLNLQCSSMTPWSLEGRFMWQCDQDPGALLAG